MNTLTAAFTVWILLLVGSIGCGSSLAPSTGGGGTGASGSGGDAGASGNAGQGGGPSCPQAPDTNAPACHPEDSQSHVFGDSVEAEGGECTPGLNCEFIYSVSTGCLQTGRATYVCCPGIFLRSRVGALPPMHSGFVPGSTTAACPAPDTGQETACALPLASTCAVEGFECRYQCQNGFCGIKVYCCNGAWQYEACTGDAARN
jgi:hypothetical protein